MDGIRSIGFVPDDRTLADWYRAATVLAFPSLWEGFGWPPLEAMASGTPVVASAIPSVCATVGQAADLVDPEDDDALAGALERIITDADHAMQLRSKGLEQAKEFTWDQTARLTLAVYDEVSGTTTSADALLDKRLGCLTGPTPPDVGAHGPPTC
jgi:glycosyltransferase involved in cell wall biosynthesis